MPVSKEIGEALLALMEESDTLPIVAAIPIIAPTSSSPDEIVLGEWGCAARVLRLVKPASRNPRQPYLVSLHGLTRIRLLAPKAEDLSSVLDELVSHDIEYPPTEKVPPREVVEKFKQSALRMLDRADYHQVSVVRLAVTVGDAAQLGTAFGSETVDAARAALARALRGVVPPDAPLWTEQHDRVVALVRQEECDLTAWRAEVETALVAVSPDRVPTVPTATWRTTSTDDLGYRLDDLEADD